jgi:hypothetical protein
MQSVLLKHCTGVVPENVRKLPVHTPLVAGTKTWLYLMTKLV